MSYQQIQEEIEAMNKKNHLRNCENGKKGETKFREMMLP